MLTRTSSSNVKPTVTCVLPEKHSSKAVNFDDQTCELVHRSRILVLKSVVVVVVVIMESELSRSVAAHSFGFRHHQSR
jgi:hypothetical protein